MDKRVILTGGGTAGHIYPALALADKLQGLGIKVAFAGTENGVEAKLTKNCNFEFVSFNVSGFDRSRPWTGASALAKLFASKNNAKRWLKVFKPDAVVGFGGYVSVPVVMAAQKLGIKTAVHEQNSVMGIANADLSKHADLVCLTYKTAADKVSDKNKIKITGNPVRSEVLSAKKEEGRALYNIDKDALVLLVFGGSLGAKSINDAIFDLKDQLLNNENLHIIHICGKRDFDEMSVKLDLDNGQLERYHLVDYCFEMPKTLACADLIVSRAGATSLAEISARKIPAILVPFPYATADHQTKNAIDYVKSGAAFMIEDSLVGTDEFADEIFELVNNEGLRKKMRFAAETFKTENAADKLCNAIVELIK